MRRGEREWRRIALTAEQAQGRDLPIVVKLDRRYRPPRRHKAIEVEALGQGVVTAIIRGALDELVPEPLADLHAREHHQRNKVRRSLAGGEPT